MLHMLPSYFNIVVIDICLALQKAELFFSVELVNFIFVCALDAIAWLAWDDSNAHKLVFIDVV